MPVRRLPNPTFSGPISRRLWGGYLLGLISPYRYMHEYLLGFDRTVRGSEVLFPVDLGHPTSYQCLKHRPSSKVVVQCWENIPYNWPWDRPLAKHYEAVLEKADFFVPFTKIADQCLRLQGVGADRREQIYCGLDVRAFHPPLLAERRMSREAMNAKEDDVVVTFVGRVAFHKGIFSLLEALTDADHRLRLQVVGSGKDLRAAEKRAQRLGVSDRVRFWGPVPNGELQGSFLWGADITVVPSIPTDQWREQFSAVVMESMAVGLPVVASRTGGIPEEVVDGTTGLLCTPDQPQEIAEALNRLAADPELRHRMGIAGRARAEEVLDAQKNSAALAKILRERVLA